MGMGDEATPRGGGGGGGTSTSTASTSRTGGATATATATATAAATAIAKAKVGGGGALKVKRKHAPAHRKSERLPLCATCRRIERWGTTYLSREMIRLTPVQVGSDGSSSSSSSNDGGDGNGAAAEAGAGVGPRCRRTRFCLAVRGTNAALVRVDGIPVYDEESQCHRDAAFGGGYGGGDDDDGWVGNADLMVGSILSIECSRTAAAAAAADAEVPVIGRLAFVLKNIDVSHEPGNPADRARVVRFDAVGSGDSIPKDDREKSDPSTASGTSIQLPPCKDPSPPIETTDLDTAIKNGSDDASSDDRRIIDARAEDNDIAGEVFATIVLKKSAVGALPVKKDARSESDDSEDEEEPMILLPNVSTKPKGKKTESKETTCAAVDLTENAKVAAKSTSHKREGEIIEVLEIDDSPDDAAMLQPGAEGASGDPQPPLVVHFLAVGRKMSHHRIEKLASNLARKDPSVEVVDSFRKPDVTHIVIDEGVPASQAAEALGFVDEKGMAKVVRRRKLVIVTPKWVFDVDAAHLRDTPAMNLVWPGLKHSAKPAPNEKYHHDDEPKKESLLDESTMLSYQPTTQPDDSSVSSRDSVAEKSDDDFSAVKKVSLESLDDDDPAARMLKRKKQIARKYHNVGLFNMFLEVSKLHVDSPVEELDNFKSKLYAKLAWRLKYLDFDVTLASVGRLEEIDGFGPSVMKKVREYLMTKTCDKISAFREDPLRIAVKNITEIWGIGKKKAHELARGGVTTIDDVRKSLDSGRLELSKNALLGVRYYEDLKEKMKRSEVDEITRIVLSVCRSIPGLEGVIITNQGSYRRGDERCGDADLLLVHPKHVDQLPKGGLGAIINKLEEQGHVCFTVLRGISDQLRVFGLYKKPFSSLAN